MFNSRIGTASAPYRSLLFLCRSLVLGALLATLSFSAVAAPRYISDFDVRRHLREDCRDIIRKAKFFISARCSFSLIAVDRGTGSVPAGMSRRPAEPEDLDTNPSAREQNYSPSLDIDLIRKEQRLKAERERRKALIDGDTPKKGRYSHMRVLARAKGFIRDVAFEVVYRLKWTPSNLYTREVLEVTQARNLRMQLPNTGRAGGSADQSASPQRTDNNRKRSPQTKPDETRPGETAAPSPTSPQATPTTEPSE